MVGITLVWVSCPGKWRQSCWCHGAHSLSAGSDWGHGMSCGVWQPLCPATVPSASGNPQVFGRTHLCPGSQTGGLGGRPAQLSVLRGDCFPSLSLQARSLLYQFHLLPRIPCSLHDLCKLCGTGMWDSGFIPAVECSGHHPESESCPYGGLVEVSSPKPGSEGKKGLKTRDVFAFRK